MPNGSAGGFASIRLWMGWLYWFLVLLTFVGLRYADAGWAEGGIPLVLMCLPWSVVVVLLGGTLSMLVPASDQVLPLEALNFLLFVVICGGLNAVLIIGIRRVNSWFSAARLRGIWVAATVMLLAGATQIVMPRVDQDALERSRPKNVSPDATHVGGAIGWWQHCTFDASLGIDRCTIWNRGGLVLEEGEFVPYDRGYPASAQQLQIIDGISGPDRICLRNGRILIPKSREAEMRKFLDWHDGKYPIR